jgi:hypothetical protein
VDTRGGGGGGEEKIQNLIVAGLRVLLFVNVVVARFLSANGHGGGRPFTQEQRICVPCMMYTGYGIQLRSGTTGAYNSDNNNNNNSILFIDHKHPNTVVSPDEVRTVEGEREKKNRHGPSFTVHINVIHTRALPYTRAHIY